MKNTKEFISEEDLQKLKDLNLDLYTISLIADLRSELAYCEKDEVEVILSVLTKGYINE